ncbi:MAG: hypothetical protein KDE31_22965, partial [Caldilineaceae bacterium]|nr:hypothetical protein [Caldilineaceae bacterium]
LTIALRAQAGALPNVNRLNATLRIASASLDESATPSTGTSPAVIPAVNVEQAVINIALRPDPEIPATFQGTLAAPRLPIAQAAVLVVEEIGPDQLSRPQRIPLLIPPDSTTAASTTAERYSYGRNDTLLKAIATTGGGLALELTQPETVPPFFQSRPPEERGDPLWPWLVVAATIFYLTAIGLRRLDI